MHPLVIARAMTAQRFAPLIGALIVALGKLSN